MNFCDQLVESWLKAFFEERDAGRTTLEEEIMEVRGTISNERLWALGSTNDEEIDAHETNIEALTEYLTALLEIYDVYKVVGGEK